MARAVSTIPRIRTLEIQQTLADKRVLIVDDSATNRRILTLQTESWKMVPRAAISAMEALEWIRDGAPFDVAILDMQMPGMDGAALAREIKKFRQEKPLPMVMLTSMGFKEKDFDTLFAAFLTKPVKQSQLYDTLVSVFEGHPKSVKEASLKAELDPKMAEHLPLRILLAEDNAVNQKVALRILAKMGYRAEVAANGLEVLDALRRQPFDLILMDMQMPEMTDSTQPGSFAVNGLPARPRIIAMTANAMQGDREICLEAGMDDYVTKPVQVLELQEALRRWGSVGIESVRNNNG